MAALETKGGKGERRRDGGAGGRGGSHQPSLETSPLSVFPSSADAMNLTSDI